MRTTVDLPDDVHTIVVNIARDAKRSLSATIADIVERVVKGVDDGDAPVGEITYHPVTGFPQMRLGNGVVTSEDVRSLEDEW